MKNVHCGGHSCSGNQREEKDVGESLKVPDIPPAPGLILINIETLEIVFMNQNEHFSFLFSSESDPTGSVDMTNLSPLKLD